jgi:TFIIF-interacting CTD phosphatase-like protein
MAIDVKTLDFYLTLATSHPDNLVTIPDPSYVHAVFSRIKSKNPGAFLAEYDSKHVIAITEIAKEKLAKKMIAERNKMLQTATDMQDVMYKLSLARKR